MHQSRSVFPPHKMLIKKIKQKETKAFLWGAHAPSRAVCRALAANPLASSMSLAHAFPRSSRWRGRHRQHARARALPRALVAICFSIFCATGFAQNPDSVAEREVQRRQSAIPQGEAALAR